MQILKRTGRFNLAWLVAGLVTIALAVILQSQRQVSMLNDVDGGITLSERLSMTVYNLQHMSGLYGIFILFGLLVAFLAGSLFYRFTRFGRPIIYAVAGATAMVVMLFAMKEAFFGVHLIAGARDALGIALQGVAGACGGFVFARMFSATPTFR